MGHGPRSSWSCSPGTPKDCAARTSGSRCGRTRHQTSCATCSTSRSIACASVWGRASGWCARASATASRQSIPWELDARRFEAAVTRCAAPLRRGGESTTRSRQRSHLYRGQFLHGESAGDWHFEIKETPRGALARGDPRPGAGVGRGGARSRGGRGPSTTGRARPGRRGRQPVPDGLRAAARRARRGAARVPPAGAGPPGRARGRAGARDRRPLPADPSGRRGLSGGQARRRVFLDFFVFSKVSGSVSARTLLR